MPRIVPRELRLHTPRWLRVELLLDGRLRISQLAETMRVCWKLGIAVFADSEQGNVLCSLYGPKIALRHG